MPATASRAANACSIYEQRLWSTNYPHNTDSGAEFYGTKGQMFLSRRGKIEVRGDETSRSKSTIEPKPQDDKTHVAQLLRSDSRQRQAQRRRPHRPPHRVALPPGQHRHPPGPLAQLRSRHRADHRRRRSQPPRRPHLSRPLGHAENGLRELVFPSPCLPLSPVSVSPCPTSPLTPHPFLLMQQHLQQKKPGIKILRRGLLGSHRFLLPAGEK